MKNNKSIYQAVVTDFDWTLVYEQKKINPKTKEAVIKYLKKGYPFIIVTGRPLFTLLPQVEEFGFTKYPSFHMSTYNGAAFTNGMTKKTIYSDQKVLPSEIYKIHEILNPLKINLLLY